MISLVGTELRKLNGSLALLLALLAPAFPAVLVMLSTATSEKPAYWSSIFTSFMLPIWGLFLMPMIIAAFTTLMAQIEYQGRGWDHILALPLRRWQIFAAKAVVVITGLVAMTFLAVIFTVLGALLGSEIGGNPIKGTPDCGKLATVTGSMLASALLFVVLQSWVALRYASFVVPLAFGIGGTMVALAVAITGTTQADWFPWVMPMKILTAQNPWEIGLVGAASGMFVLVLMVADLSRRSFR
jgi:lantibiotic transport system permease protein